MASSLPVRVQKVAPTEEPITLAQAKLRAAVNWPDGDPRDDQMNGFISAARDYVEKRTARAIASQTQQLFYDAAAVSVGAVLQLPASAQPLVSVGAVASTDAAGVETVLAATAYEVHLGTGTIVMLGPLPTDVRASEGWRVQVTCGNDVATLDPGLVQIIGLLTAHYQTSGRDLVTLTQATEMPQGFEDALLPFLPQVLA